MYIAFTYHYITIKVFLIIWVGILECWLVREKSAKTTLPIPERLVQGCLLHRILWVPFLLHGDDSVMASYHAVRAYDVTGYEAGTDTTD